MECALWGGGFFYLLEGEVKDFFHLSEGGAVKHFLLHVHTQPYSSVKITTEGVFVVMIGMLDLIGKNNYQGLFKYLAITWRGKGYLKMAIHEHKNTKR